jgi:hypothetical protein
MKGLSKRLAILEREYFQEETLIYVYGGIPLEENEPRELLIKNKCGSFKIIRMRDQEHEW